MKLACIKCEKNLENILADIPLREGQQPVGGLAFMTTGHYGSSFFDPMDGTYIEVSICDECLIDADKRGCIFYSRRALASKGGER